MSTHRCRPLFRLALLGIAYISGLSASTAAAGSLVEFPNVSEQSPARLFGYLARPDRGLSGLTGGASRGAAPYAAVIVLHGCGGISSHSAALADKFGSWGYVGLAVDSLGARGMAHRCNGSFLDQAYDAYAALRYLATQEFVDPARIAVFGQSMGGSAVLNAIDYGMFAQYFTERFRAGIALYPGGCLPAARMTAPTMILIGDADDWTPAERCRGMIAHALPDSEPIALTVYPGAYHAFDVVQLQPGRSSFGHWLEYDEPAAKDAEQKVRAFLAAHLAAMPGEAAAK